MNINKTAVAVIAVGLIVYICTPYYSSWRMMKAVQVGSAEQMQRYIDFPQVQASIKQQIDTAFEQQAGLDPMAAMMAEMFQPLLNKIIEELVLPDKLAEFIKSGKLNSQQKTKTKKETTEPKNTSKPASWYAFFDRPARFRIAVDELMLYMELQDWQWQVTAIGVEDMLDMNRSRNSGSTTLVADEIDTNSPVPPSVIADLDLLKAEIDEAFFIAHDFGNHVQVEGDFYYSSAKSVIKPKVIWLNAFNANGDSVLGQFSKEDQEKREKYHWGNHYSSGKWHDDLPKLSATDKVVIAKGICRVSVPTKVEHYALNVDHLQQMQLQENTAVTVTEIVNGNISLSYYTPFDGPKTDPVIIVHNAKGQPLKQGGAFSSTPEEAIEDPRFNQPMRGTTKSITIAGTPQAIDMYFPLKPVTVEHEFTTASKPEVTFGELKTPITRTRYAPPVREDDLKVIDREQLKNASSISFHEETRYDKTKRRYVKLTLPDIANSTFARTNVDSLKISLGGQPVDVKSMRHHNRGNEYRVYFSEKGKDWSANLDFDHIKGRVVIKYPSKIEIIKILQGQMHNGVRLDGAVLIYPKGRDIPDFSSSFNVRSVIAYHANKKQIELLNNSSTWSRKENKIYFWGEPDYVELKQVSQWIELQIPVELSAKDLVIDEQ